MSELQTLCDVCHGLEHGNVQAVHEWPLNEDGKEKFFGYILWIRKVSNEAKDGAKCCVAEFEYNQEVDRYFIPDNAGLIKSLSEYAEINGNPEISCDGPQCKLWVKRIKGGEYEVDMT